MYKPIPQFGREVVSSLIQTGTTSLTLCLLVELEGPAAIAELSRFIWIKPKVTTMAELQREFRRYFCIGSSLTEKSERQKWALSGLAGSTGSIEILEWLRKHDMIRPIQVLGGAAISQQYQVATWLLSVDPNADIGHFNSDAWTLVWTPTSVIDSNVTEPNIIAANAALHGKMDQLDLTKVTDLPVVLRWANQGGHLEIIKMIAEMGTTNWNQTLQMAAQMGYLQIVEYVLDHHANVEPLDFTRAIEEAIVGDQTAITKLLIERHASLSLLLPMPASAPLNFNLILRQAICSGNLEMVQFAFENGANDSLRNLTIAANMGHLDLVEFLVQRGTNQFEDAFVAISDPVFCSRKFGDEQCDPDPEKSIVVANYFLPRLNPETRLETLNQALIRASSNNRKCILRLVLELGANALNAAFLQACRSNRYKVMQILIEHGANNFDAALTGMINDSFNQRSFRFLLDRDLERRQVDPAYVGVNHTAMIIVAKMIENINNNQGVMGAYLRDRSDMIRVLQEYQERASELDARPGQGEGEGQGLLQGLQALALALGRNAGQGLMPNLDQNQNVEQALVLALGQNPILAQALALALVQNQGQNPDQDQ